MLKQGRHRHSIGFLIQRLNVRRIKRGEATDKITGKFYCPLVAGLERINLIRLKKVSLKCQAGVIVIIFTR